ncbi:hypothetical protein [Kitasatospora sp. NPDC097643]|uniref:hypothetical protein n=1 Tax=Kitasatospora sp. NPDC097643 TaxID=3157230 RepID=UPI003320DC92
MTSITRAGLAVGAALLLAACSSGGGSTATTGAPSAVPPASTAATATVTPTATWTPTVPPYGPALSRQVDPVNAALVQIAAAKNLTELNAALGALDQAAQKGANGLPTSYFTPAGAVAGQAELIPALRKLSGDAAKVRGDITKKNVCAVSSALAEFGQSEGLKTVPAALTKLTAAGYQTTFTVPETPKAQTRTLENGTLVREGRLRGEGVFKVDNGGKSDAVVSLALNGKSVHSVYVAKGEKASIEGIEDGTYEVFFAGGVDWDSDAKAFTQNCRFTKFQDTLAFETGRTATSWSITLQPTLGGNAKTDDVDANNFPQP